MDMGSLLRTIVGTILTTRGTPTSTDKLSVRPILTVAHIGSGGCKGGFRLSAQ